ncbi:hypothetical protein PoB_005776500 [Plakobranchus ocellatus]|uniref:Uncharacterized protein n=1 Tax=Plakobranchus ocellatus TaxID=259542 RepID=A0AAV4CI59_9GAST|nr:hypothetical protein PoB_005776500 [Plakobranchus ocellatus]
MSVSVSRRVTGMGRLLDSCARTGCGMDPKVASEKGFLPFGDESPSDRHCHLLAFLSDSQRIPGEIPFLVSSRD